MTQEIAVNLRIDEYTNRVLGVVKEKYGLKDKAAALNFFAKLHGEMYVDPAVLDKSASENIRIAREHIKKYGFTPRTIEDFEKRNK